MASAAFGSWGIARCMCCFACAVGSWGLVMMCFMVSGLYVDAPQGPHAQARAVRQMLRRRPRVGEKMAPGGTFCAAPPGPGRISSQARGAASAPGSEMPRGSFSRRWSEPWQGRPPVIHVDLII